MAPILRGFLFALGIFSACLPAAAGENVAVNEMAIAPSDLAAFFDERVPALLGEFNVPGAAVVVVEGDDIVFRGGYGLADRANNVRFDPQQTIVAGGSIMKTVTALAAMQLVEQGRLDLDRDVNEYLTSVKVPDTFAAPITMRQLLHYTAGLDSRFIGIRAQSLDDLEPLADYLARRLPTRVRPPGEVRAYNDHEIALAALVIEEIAGQPFADYVREHIFGPLEMPNATLQLSDSQQQRMAVGYSASGPYPANSYFLRNAPGAGFHTTPVELGHLLIAHLGEGRYKDRQVLSAESMRELHTTRFRHRDSFPGIAYTFDETLRNGLRVLAKSGGAPGFQNRLWLLPEQQLGVYFVYNRDSSVPLWRRLEDAFFEEFFPAEEAGAETVEANAEASSISVAACAGYYRDLNDYSAGSLEKVQSLLHQVRVAAVGADEIEVFGTRMRRAGPDLFASTDGDFRVAFSAGDDADAKYLFVARSGFERVPWYETFPLQIGLLAGSSLVFAGVVVGWCVTLVARRGAKINLARAVSLLNLLFLIGAGLLFAPVFSGPDPPWQFSFDPPTVLYALLTVPLLATALAVGLAIQTVRRWKLPATPRTTNVLVLVASGAFGWFLWTWNLWGYWL